jgi:hypothetical protein
MLIFSLSKCGEFRDQNKNSKATCPAGRIALNFYLSFMVCYLSCTLGTIFEINFADAIDC